MSKWTVVLREPGGKDHAMTLDANSHTDSARKAEAKMGGRFEAIDVIAYPSGSRPVRA